MSINDPKYDFVDGKIVNVHTGKEIPPNEPVLVLRAKDVHALPVLQAYGRLCKDKHHQEAIQGRIDEFEEYKRKHPSYMNEPDTPPVEDTDVVQGPEEDIQDVDAGDSTLSDSEGDVSLSDEDEAAGDVTGNKSGRNRKKKNTE